ncbi:MAG: MBL fold metallo-hydrolase [Acidobacteria bacterium]|nr:MBL fold metallo-hydrolase [Acidobacteriota bacterium]
MKISDCLYAYPWRGNDNNCNSYLFAGVLKGNRHVVVDPGHLVTPAYQEPGLERLFSEMSRDGIDGSQIGLAILTHGHPDHCEAAVILRQEYDALTALHEADEPVFKMLGGKADLFLDEGELSFDSGKPAKLQVYHSPGHTPGHVTLYWPEQKVLIAGDCIFYRSTGRTDFPGGDARSLQQSVARLSGLDVEWLLCGHAYGNSGILKGKEGIRENFRFIQSFFGSGAL